ncbi:40S ribosomal protein S4 [Gigaspora margarita]|uniref:40S ribosomal protein S4 n=1 Tax=Gigaspora margarita TaxID=4874 RepID=A0A8H4AQZ7_GIGMA|nr:40S ribosomal protein S4 [Gigaspora margarita]
MDVITIEKNGENFRLIYDAKGRFTIHKITADEATYKLAKVKRVQFVNDTVRIDLKTGKIIEHIKFEGTYIIHVKDAVDRQFATLLTNDFIIGEGNKPSISLLKGKGVKLTISEERDRSVFKKLNQKYNKFLRARAAHQ